MTTKGHAVYWNRGEGFVYFRTHAFLHCAENEARYFHSLGINAYVCIGED